jgi:DNA-binding NtrC family response regulator
MKKHILTVDDEVDIRELLQQALGFRGYRVSTAADAVQARKIVTEDPPQLIIMDFQIEEGDGFVLIEEMKKLAPATPILLLTGAFFDHQVVRDVILKRVAGYLDKTATLAMIVGEIQRLLGDPPDAPAHA